MTRARRGGWGAIAVLVALLGASALASGCTERQKAPALPDSGARPAGATAGGPARRIVSIAPAATEIVFALGAGAQVVGVSRYCDHPPEARKLPKVGGFLDPNLEAIVLLRPDLVVGSTNGAVRPLVEQLGRLGIRTAFPAVDTPEQVLAAMLQIGEAIGRPERARAEVGRLRAEIERLKERLRGRKRVRTLVLHGHRPLVAAGRGSYAHALVELAGGENVAATGPVKYPTLSLEQVIALAPDVVVDASMEERPIASMLAPLKAVPAVREGRIVRPAGGLLLHPGPRVVDALRALIQALHPDLR